ncbi:MAG: PqqD family protein [Lachnospiraceae bacterium]|nr:PqqD family protein [Lachnospiraceae bacterium]
MNGNGKLIASEDFILREIGGEAVLVHVGDNAFFENSVVSMNETYAFLLKQFAEASTVDECLEAAKREYEDPEGRMETEVKGAVGELVKLGILKPA